jgi:hypothetical protein
MRKIPFGTAVISAVMMTVGLGCSPAIASDPTDNLTMTISPSVIVLDNPAERGDRKPTRKFGVSVTVKDAYGNPVLPSPEQPITLNIYEPTVGPVWPSTAQLTSEADSTASFTYDGNYFSNPMILTATMGNASASTSIVQQNQSSDCTFGKQHYTIHYPEPMRTIEHGFDVAVSVGGGPWHSGIELDTGSTGLTIAQSSLGPQAIGPGQPGSRTYHPSGLEVIGNYWLTPVSVAIPSRWGGTDKVMTTVPVEVFAISKVQCNIHVKTCKPPTDQEKAIAGFGLMGVGFDRGGVLPSNNVFLQLEDIVYGRMSPGYVFSPDQVSIGLDREDTAEGFDYVTLDPNSETAGDWRSVEGCFRFPAVSKRFCGSMLLDTGIDSMLLGVAADARPAAVVDPSDSKLLAPGTAVDITAPEMRPWTLRDPFYYQPNSPRLIVPKLVHWVKPPSTPPYIFFNIGRTPLARFDYLYDARCGQVGFYDRMTAQ